MTYTIYIKPTNRCNLKCDHCFNEIMQNHDDIDDRTLERSIQWINNFIDSHPNDDIDCQLHGGEPCLYSIDKLNGVVDRVNNRARWSITTNLVYQLTDKHIELFKRMQPYHNNDDIVIQTSWDHSIRFKSPKQQALWEDNVRVVVGQGITVQPTVCITSYIINSVSPADLFDYMIALGVTQINFERLTNTGRAVGQIAIIDKHQYNLIPTNKQTDQWLFDAYKTSKLPKYQHITIPIFQGVEQSIKGELLGCRARKCMQTVYTINPDGSIGGCPNTACYAPNNVNTIQWVENKLIKKEQIQQISCLSCQYYQYCNGECFQLKHDDTGCPGMKSIYQYLLG